jgi:hypothetical protein
MAVRGRIVNVDAERLARVLARIDAANAADPNLVAEHGEWIPKELLDGRRMSEALAKLVPAPSELLQIAVRAHHLERWKIPRETYPPGRAGYLRWRTDLARMHADRAGFFMRLEGYDDDAIARVQALIQKKQLGRDPEAQALEDCACLVFLEHHLETFARKHDGDKVIAILRKTWAKMSERGRAAALALPLTLEARAWIEKALR